MMSKHEARWLAQDIDSTDSPWRYRRLILKAPNQYTVEIENRRTGERRELASWQEWIQEGKNK